MKSVRTNREARCPACMKSLTGATSFDDATPSPGDLSICVYCMNVLQFQTDLTVRSLRADELAELPADMRAEVEKHQRTVAAFIKSTRRRTKHE